MADPAPIRQDITLYQDSTFVMEILYKPEGAEVDLTSWRGDMDIAPDFSTPAVLHVDEQEGIVFGANSQVTITITDELTNSLVLYDEVNEFRYDVHIENPAGERLRIAMGKCTIIAKVKGP